jgi:hypothetical protein
MFVIFVVGYSTLEVFIIVIGLTLIRRRSQLHNLYILDHVNNFQVV